MLPSDRSAGSSGPSSHLELANNLNNFPSRVHSGQQHSLPSLLSRSSNLIPPLLSTSNMSHSRCAVSNLDSNAELPFSSALTSPSYIHPSSYPYSSRSAQSPMSSTSTVPPQSVSSPTQMSNMSRSRTNLSGVGYVSESQSPASQHVYSLKNEPVQGRLSSSSNLRENCSPSSLSVMEDDRDARLERAVALVNSCRYSVRKAAHALQLPKSTVHRYLQATRELNTNGVVVIPVRKRMSNSTPRRMSNVSVPVVMSMRSGAGQVKPRKQSKCDISFLMDG